MGIGIGITLDDVDATHHYLSGSLRLTWRINERGACSLSWRSNIRVEHGTAVDVPDLVPEIGQQIAIFDGNGRRLFTGDVTEVRTYQMAPRWQYGVQIKGGMRTDITLASLEQRLEKRVVLYREDANADLWTPAYAWLPDADGNKPTAKDIIHDILDNTRFGDVAAAEGIQIGDIADGATLDSFIVGQDGAATVWSVLDHLARLSGDYYVQIDPETFFYFREREFKVAPFAVGPDCANVEPDIRVTMHRHDMRTVQYHRIAWEAFDPYIWAVEGDGSWREFNLKFIIPSTAGEPLIVDARPVRIESMTLIRGNEEIPVKFGTRDVDGNPVDTSGVEFYWAPGDPRITMHVDAVTLQAGEVLQVRFRRLGADSVSYEAEAEPGEPELEVIERASEDLSCKSEDEGIDAATQTVQQHQEPKFEVSFATNERLEATIAELRTGQLMRVHLPYHNVHLPNQTGIPVELLVDEIAISDERGTIIDYKVHCISGTRNPKYTDFFRSGIGSGSSGESTSKKKTQELNKGETWAPYEEKSFAFGTCEAATGTDVTFHANVMTSGIPYSLALNSKEGSSGTVDIMYSSDGSAWTSLTGGTGFATSGTGPHLFDSPFNNTQITAPGLLRADVISGSIEWGVATLRWKRLPPESGDLDAEDPGNPLPAVI